MAFKKGQSGNPKGRASEKPWRDALMVAINERMGETKALRLAADQLVRQALKGDVAALKELGDRLDGKPRQEIEATVEQTNYVAEVPPVQKDSEEWAAQHAPKTIM